MSRLLRILMLSVLTAFAALPALWQTASAKPQSPGEMATMDRAAIQNRAACEREAREQKLSYLKRRQFVKGCIRR